MKGINFVFILLLLITGGCAMFSQLDKLEEQANEAYKDDRIEDSFELYEELIEAHVSRDNIVDNNLYQRAGMLAYRLEKIQKAINHFEAAREQTGLKPESLIALAKSYRQIDNLSLEIRTLEEYVNNFPEGDEISYMRSRYFETLVESENWKRAYEFWPELEGEPLQDNDLLEGYFRVNKELENDDLAKDLAEKLLEKNENNKLALDWTAKKYYYKGIDRYNHEMEAYQNNRTHRQYAQLREAWPVIHQNLRTSRDYFLRLYNIEPKDEYARFLANIYERLDNDAKARYYQEKID